MDIDKSREYLKKVTDGLGKGIDKGIFETVLYMNVHDLPTTASCEGHLKWGIAGPWIDFSTKKADEFQNEYLKLLNEREIILEKNGNNFEDNKVEILSQKLDALDNKIYKANSKITDKLMILLADFYSNSDSDVDSRLVLTGYGRRWRLQSQGALFQESRNQEERKKFLEIYREEMDKFTEFLKKNV